MTKILRPVLAALLLIILAACGPAPPGKGETEDLSIRPIRVVCTTGMIADAAGIVGSDRVEVTGLMGPGVDPHSYRASEGDVAALAGADLVFYNGLNLEAKLAEVLERMTGRTRTVAVTADMPRDRLIAAPEFHNHYDPHVWFDVDLWKLAVERITKTFEQIDPPHGEAYRRRAEAYLSELDQLREFVLQETARLPADRRILVTSHDAFNYYGRAGNLQVRGLQGISTASEAGAADVRSLAEFITRKKIPAIFVESSVPRRTLEAVQEAARSAGADVRIGGELFSDSLGSRGTPEGTYVGMVRYNTRTIVEALYNPDSDENRAEAVGK